MEQRNVTLAKLTCIPLFECPEDGESRMAMTRSAELSTPSPVLVTRKTLQKKVNL